MGVTRRRNLEQLYSGPRVLEVPPYSVFEASRYLRIPENTLRSWVKDVINASRHGQLAMRDPIGLHLERGEWDKDGFVARIGRKKVPEALRAAGVEIRVHDELFPHEPADELARQLDALRSS